MKTVTIDASAAASWIFPTQGTKASDAFASDSAAYALIAPGIFAWEIGNQIAARSRGTGRPHEEFLGDLDAFAVEIVTSPASSAVFRSIGTALSRGLSLFDNAYLQLCLERDAALATRDALLIEAARIAGVDVFDLRD